MTKKAKKKKSAPESTERRAKANAEGERRKNRELREVLDELLDHVRQLAASAHVMGPSEREYAQERLEWLADEVWRFVVEGRESR